MRKKLRCAGKLPASSPPPGDEDRAEEGGPDDEAEEAELAGGIGEVLVADKAIDGGPYQRGDEQEHEDGPGDCEIAAAGAGGALPAEYTCGAKHNASRLRRDLTFVASVKTGQSGEQLRIGGGGMGRRNACARVVLDERFASGRPDCIGPELIGRVHGYSHETMSGRRAKRAERRALRSGSN